MAKRKMKWKWEVENGKWVTGTGSEKVWLLATPVIVFATLVRVSNFAPAPPDTHAHIHYTLMAKRSDRCATKPPNPTNPAQELRPLLIRFTVEWCLLFPSKAAQNNLSNNKRKTFFTPGRLRFNTFPLLWAPVNPTQHEPFWIDRKTFSYTPASFHNSFHLNSVQLMARICIKS